MIRIKEDIATIIEGKDWRIQEEDDGGITVSIRSWRQGGVSWKTFLEKTKKIRAAGIVLEPERYYGGGTSLFSGGIRPCTVCAARVTGEALDGDILGEYMCSL